MSKRCFLVLFLLVFSGILYSQSTTLPVDWRQHNLSKYNANVFNAAFSFVRNEGTNLSLWGRLQWVGIENSPTTYLINYNGKVGERSGAGIALFQHNIGLFTDSGLMVNYARGIQLARRSWLTFGINLVGLRRGLNQASFITPEPDPALLNSDQDFILAVMPGINLTINGFSIGFSSENLFDYNFTSSDQQTDFSDKIFLGHLSYDYRLINRGSAAWNNAIFRTTVYGKTIPDQDLQYGVQTFIDVPKYGWAQLGYNNFYGVSGGLGAKVTDGISVGFLVETGTNATSAFGATYEVTAAIEFGKRASQQAQARRKDKPITFKEGPKPKKKQKNLKPKKEINKITPVVINSPKKTIDTTQLNDQNIEDIALDKLTSIDRDTDKKILNKVFKSDNANPRYKSVERIEGVEYGFYLVVNVFSQKKYFELFMRLLKSQGLAPKYFFNTENDYYYVYLRKYDKLSQIEKDRRSKYNDKYAGETWILWVRNN